MCKIKSFVSAQKRKLLLAAFPVAAAMISVVPSFASQSVPDGTIDPAIYDVLVSGITSNIGAVMPKVLIVLALLTGIGVVIGLIRNNARAPK